MCLWELIYALKSEKWNQSGILLKCMATSRVFLFVLIEDLWFLTETFHLLVVDPTYWRLHPLQWTKFNDIKGTIWQSFLSLNKICFVSLQTENFLELTRKLLPKSHLVLLHFMPPGSNCLVVMCFLLFEDAWISLRFLNLLYIIYFLYRHQSFTGIIIPCKKIIKNEIWDPSGLSSILHHAKNNIIIVLPLKNKIYILGHCVISSLSHYLNV